MSVRECHLHQCSLSSRDCLPSAASSDKNLNNIDIKSFCLFFFCGRIYMWLPNGVPYVYVCVCAQRSTMYIYILNHQRKSVDLCTVRPRLQHKRHLKHPCGVDKQIYFFIPRGQSILIRGRTITKHRLRHRMTVQMQTYLTI